MIRFLVACMLASLLAIGCSANDQPRVVLSEDDQIREVVFRYQFEHNASG